MKFSRLYRKHYALLSYALGLTLITAISVIFSETTASLITQAQSTILTMLGISFGASLVINFRLIQKNQKQAKNHNRFQSELETAQLIQQSFLSNAPKIKGYDIAVKHVSPNPLGGDFYHFFETHDHLGIIIGDVSGHSISSALVTALLEGIVNQAGLENLQPNQILTRINTRLNKILRNKQNYVTLIAAILDLKSGQVEYSVGGHPPLIYYSHQKHKAQELDGSGSLLGIFEDNEYELCRTQLNSGDALLFYTDGLTEARNQKREFFGEHQLEQTLEKNPTRHALETLETLYQNIDQFSPQLQDDRAAILIKKQ